MDPPGAVRVIRILTDEEILATRNVMLQLRQGLASQEYLPTVRRMMQTDGYSMAALYEAGNLRAVAGYRFMEMLYSGRILYVDDLNTDERHRSRGYGKVLMDWLKAEAKTNDCVQRHLGSCVQREQTHRFCFARDLPSI